MKPDFDLVNYEKFVTQHTKLNDNYFITEKGPIQIYSLSSTASLIKLPTPLLRMDYNFFLFFSHGGAIQCVDNDVLDFKPCDVLFIREGHLNAINTILPNTKGYFIYIDSNILSQIFPKNSLLSKFTFNPKRSVSKSEMDWICKCVELIIQDRNVDNPSIEIQISMLQAIVLKLANSKKTIASKPERKLEISMLFKELLYKYFIDEREVRFYAKMLSLTENYLNSCVKIITNKSPKQHINEVVISHSQILLSDFSKTISQVAFELNFNDPSYFGRLFKKITQQTPSKYRSSISQDLSEQ